MLTSAPPLCHAHQHPDCPDQITWVFNKKAPLFQRFHGFFFYLEAFLALFSRGEKSRMAFVLILLQFILLQSPPPETHSLFSCFPQVLLHLEARARRKEKRRAHALQFAHQKWHNFKFRLASMAFIAVSLDKKMKKNHLC